MADTHNLIIDQGTTFGAKVAIKTSSGLGFSINDTEVFAHIRKSASGAKLEEFTCRIIDGAQGLIHIALTPEQTRNLEPGRYMYDILVKEDENNIFRPVKGTITVTPAVTKLVSVGVSVSGY